MSKKIFDMKQICRINDETFNHLWNENCQKILENWNVHSNTYSHPSGLTGVSLMRPPKKTAKVIGPAPQVLVAPGNPIRHQQRQRDNQKDLHLLDVVARVFREIPVDPQQIAIEECLKLRNWNFYDKIKFCARIFIAFAMTKFAKFAKFCRKSKLRVCDFKNWKNQN